MLCRYSLVLGFGLLLLGGCDRGTGGKSGSGGSAGSAGTSGSGGTMANSGGSGEISSSSGSASGGSSGGAAGSGETGGSVGSSAGGSSGGKTGVGGSAGSGGAVGSAGSGAGGSGGTGRTGGAGSGGVAGIDAGSKSGTGGSGSGDAGSGGTGGSSGTGGSGAGGTTGPSCQVEYTWPTYSPTIAYDYVDEYGTLAAPTKLSKDCSNIAGSYSKDWWAFYYGSTKNSVVTSAAWIPMVDRFNTDFAYISDTMRWPRDSRARAGFYSAIYLYGSGLCTDSASNTDQGGWQSEVGGYPMVLASYYPVYSFDPACTYADKVSQQGDMIHEGIHCILASMPGCKNACWFQEGGNTWLQATMEAKRNGDAPTSMGYLSAGAAVAPFMPIECYSGWLQDDSFGGPCAERVNMTDSSGKQICTWRNLLGGNQYGETFPHALEVMLGEKSIAWIWRNASKSGRVLQDLAEVTSGLGVTQTRRLIQEYRARQAFGDFGTWKNAYKKLLNDNWKVSIAAEWQPSWKSPAAWSATCYVSTTQSGSTLTPETRTLPGWSGANQIPLTVTSGASCATVTFTPTGQNMTCQLVYQDSSGQIHYGNPVSSGECSIPVSNVKNNIVVAVITNTDYIYDGGTTKYGYTLTLGTGVSGKADIYTQWYK
jgi:hypothetical protein